MDFKVGDLVQINVKKLASLPAPWSGWNEKEKEIVLAKPGPYQVIEIQGDSIEIICDLENNCFMPSFLLIYKKPRIKRTRHIDPLDRLRDLT